MALWHMFAAFVDASWMPGVHPKQFLSFCWAAFGAHSDLNVFGHPNPPLWLVAAWVDSHTATVDVILFSKWCELKINVPIQNEIPSFHSPL